MKNEDKIVIYVGKAKHLKQRLKQYFSGGDEREMIPFLLKEISFIDTIVVFNEREALLLENTLIKKHKPKFNAILKDDKTFISLMINRPHPWPMIRLIRYKGKPKEKGLYFGPYTSAYAARQTFDLLTQLFPLRQCSDEELKRRTRPCLLYSIKKCIAPCVEKCTKEEYETFVQGAIQFLKGQNKEILHRLYKEMQQASDQLEFEKAAALLQTIRQIEHVISSQQAVVRTGGENTDVIGLFRQADEIMLSQLFFREGNLVGSEHYSFSRVLEDDDELLTSFLLQHYKEKSSPPKEILLPFTLKQAALISEILSEGREKIVITSAQKGGKKAFIALAEQNAKALFEQEKNHQELKEKMLIDLQETLKLGRYPERIECFDTSNISGTSLVASMVAYFNGDYDKKRTRLFHIRDISKGDDYAALHQALSRRLLRAKEEEDLPDLVIVDGGKGQLNVALDVFKELDIATVDVISLAKEEGRHDRGMTKERIFVPHHEDPIELHPRSPLLFLLQKIRDEAHRKAIGFHRKSRQKKTLGSSLDGLPGIGKVKKMRLLRRFGSLKRISEASIEELQTVKGLTKKDIELLKHLKENC